MAIMRGPARLRKWLGKRKGARAEFARSVGVSPAIVTMWLSEGPSRRTPGLDSAIKIERITDGFVRHTDWSEPPTRKTVGRVAARTSPHDKHAS